MKARNQFYLMLLIFGLIQVFSPAKLRALNGYSINHVSNTASTMVDFVDADIGEDGDRDILVASIASDGLISGVIGVYDNNGSGIFTYRILFSVTTSVESIYPVDMDGDGDTDVVVGGDDGVSWYENDGLEHFTHRIVVNATTATQSVFARDMDGDSDIDILNAGDTISWYENDGSGAFVRHDLTTAPDGGWDIVADDFDGDGDQDIFTTGFVDGAFRWFENNGSLVFTAHVLAGPVISLTNSGVSSADLDQDGDIDLLYAALWGPSMGWFENIGGGNFVAHEISATDTAMSVQAIDLDGDGDQDLLSNSDWDYDMFWYENDGAENFTEHFIIAGSVALAADFDGDSDIDIVGSDQAAILQFLINDGSENFTRVPLGANTPADTHVSADLDADGDIDLVISGRQGVWWYENDGSQSFSAHSIFITDSVYSIFVIDVDSDGDLDVVHELSSADSIIWNENDGSENFTPHVVNNTVLGAAGVFAIDLDQDGDIDILSTGYSDDTVSWFENNGSESFSKHVIDMTVDAAVALEAFDIDLDGDVDVLSFSSITSEIIWYENNGSESFTKHVITGTAIFAYSAHAVDLDEDGDVDIVSTEGSLLRWYENDGSENFTLNEIGDSTGGAYNSITVDVDADGDNDIVVAGGFTNAVILWRNDGSENFTRVDLTPFDAYTKSVAAADIDADGDLDFFSAIAEISTVVWLENDPVIPLVSSIQRLDSSPTNSPTVNFRVQFAEEIIGLDETDFILLQNGVGGGSIAKVLYTGSGSYVVTVGGFTGEGTFELQLVDDDSIKDRADNPLGGPGAVNGDFSAGEVYSLDLVKPSLAISTAQGTSIEDYSAVVTFAFTESVSGFTVGDVQVAGGYLDGFSGSGASYSATLHPDAFARVTLSVAADVASDSLGNLNSAAPDLELDFIEPLYAYSGTVTYSGEPLSGVEVTLGGSTVVTDGDGNFTLSGFPSGTYNLTVTFNGFSFQLPGSGEVVLGTSNISGVSLLASPAFELPFWGKWNGYLGMVNVLELVNRSATDTSLSITLYDLDGQIVGQRQIALPGLSQQDIVLNDLPGFSADSYGTVKVFGSGSDIDGRVVFYNLPEFSPKQPVGSFAFAEPLSDGNTGKSAMQYNTYHPANDGSRVLNFLSISNLENTGNNFTIRRYDIQGTLLQEDNLVIPAGGRRDIEAGHLEPGVDNVGMLTVEPDDASARYLGSVVRYAMDAKLSGFDFAIAQQACRPRLKTVYVSLLAEDTESLNYLEVGNVLDVSAAITVTIEDSVGVVAETVTMVVPAHAVRHVSVQLPSAGKGLATISSTTTGAVCAESVVYERNGDELKIAFSVPAQGVSAQRLFASYNTFFDTTNELSVFNISNSDETVDYLAHDVSLGFSPDAVISGSNTLAARYGASIALSGLPDNSYGVLELESVAMGTVQAVNLRKMRDEQGHLEFVLAVPAR